MFVCACMGLCQCVCVSVCVCVCVDMLDFVSMCVCVCVLQILSSLLMIMANKLERLNDK